MADSIKLAITPDIEVSLAVKKLRLSPEAFSDFQTYKAAFKEAYGQEISDDVLASKLIALALQKDRTLSAYKTRKDNPQPRSNGAAPEVVSPPSSTVTGEAGS